MGPSSAVEKLSTIQIFLPHVNSRGNVHNLNADGLMEMITFQFKPEARFLALVIPKDHRPRKDDELAQKGRSSPGLRYS